MRIDIERWKSEDKVLTEQKTEIVDLFRAIDNPTPEDIDNFELQKVQNQREINLHVQDLRSRIDNDYREDLVKLQLIIDYGDWSGVKGEDLHLQKSREELIAYRNDLSQEIDQANDLYTQNIPSFEETDLNYSYDGEVYSADPNYPAKDFDTNTYSGKFNDWLLNTDSGKQSVETFEKLRDKLSDVVVDVFIKDFLLKKNPNVIEKLLIEAVAAGLNVSKDELLKVLEAGKNANFGDPSPLDEVRANDAINDAVQNQRRGDVLSFQEWSEKNPLQVASSSDSVLSEAISDHRSLYNQYVEDQLAGNILDTSINDIPGDWIEGTEESDFLEGTDGDDVLEGGEGFDVMEGGEGFDTYLADDGDFINDSDQQGNIEFNGEDLTGEKTLNPDTGNYEDNNFTYKEEGGNLEVTDKNTGETITIENWDSDKKDALGIELTDQPKGIKDPEDFDDPEPPTPDVPDVPDVPPNPDDPPPPPPPKPPKPPFIPPPPDRPRRFDRYDPLALDMNRDGLISTSSVENSTTYFDITGDGLRERVGWVKGEDALLVYDKDQNGQIDGVNELFGNESEDGIAA